MADINVTMQIQDVIQQTAALLNLTQQQTEAWQKSAVAVAKFDAQLNKYVIEVKGAVETGKQLSATAEQTAVGLKVLNESLKVTESELTKTKAAEKALADATRQAARASQERQRELDKEARAEQKLNDQLAKRAQKQALENRTGALTKSVQQEAAKEQARLQALDPKLGLSAGAQSKLLVVARNIAELGAKAGLTAKQVQDMFAAVAKGDVSSIDAKYAHIVQAIVKHNAIIEKERAKLAQNAQPSTKGKGPKEDGGLPGPNEGHVAKAREYLNVLGRIQGTLTNLAIYRGFNLLTQQLISAISSAREYQTQVALIRTISQDANLSTGQWTRGLKDVSATLAVDFKDAATAAYNAVSAQIAQGQSTFQYLKDTGELARTTGSSLTEAGNVVAGVINSYKLSAADANEISAKLFRTVDLGNVTLSELSGTIGRVTGLGNDLGVSFDEILATLSTFTRNGVTTADAMTFLNNVFTKLIQPTEKMRAVLDNLGIASVESAIKAGSFRQVLGQLIDEVQKGNVDAAELFPEIRGEKGFASFRQNLKEFDRDLVQIRDNSRQYFENAKNIISETDADQINRFTTTLKGVLTSQVGDNVNKFLAGLVGIKKGTEDAIQFTERLEKTVQKVIQVIVTGGVGLGTFVVGMRALGVILELNAARSLRAAIAIETENAAKIKGVAATNALSAAESRYNMVKRAGIGGLATAGPVGALGTLAVVGLTAYTTYEAMKSTATDSYTAIGAAYDDYAKRLKEGQEKKELDRQLSVVEKMKQEFKEISSEVGKRLQDGLAANNLRITELNEKLKESAELFKEAFAGTLNSSKDKIQEIQRSIDQVTASLRGQDRKTADFKESLRQNALGTANRFANPQQQLQLLSNEFGRVKAQITNLVKQGTPEALAEAEKMYDKLGTLATQFYEKQADMQKAAFEEGIKQQVAEGFIPGGNYTFLYDQTAQLKTNNEIINLRNRLDAQGNALLQKRKELLDAEKATAQKALEAREKRIKDFETFSVLTDKGKVKEQFLTNTGILDVDKVKKAYADLTKSLEADIGADFLKRADARKVFDERGNQIAEQVQRVLVGNDLVKTQEDLAKATEAANTSFEAGKKGLAEYDATMKGIGVDARTLVEQLRAVNETAPGSFAGVGARQRAFGRLGAVGRAIEAQNDDGRSKPTQEMFDATKAKVIALIEEFKNLEKQKIKVGGIEIIDPEKAKSALDRLRELKAETLGNLKKASETYRVDIDPAAVRLPGSPTATINDLQRMVEDLESRLEKATTGRLNSTGLIAKAQSDLEAYKQKLNEVTNAIDGQTKALQGFVGGLGNVTQDSIGKLEMLNQKAKELNATIKNMSSGIPFPGERHEVVPGSGVYGWTVPETKQYGGPVYRAYGGPVGNDNIPAWLSNREIVVNRSASDRFFSQIMSMNNMARVPQYFNNGGQVSNGGPVTFNVYESKNPQATAREVDRLLRRSKRLGNT